MGQLFLIVAVALAVGAVVFGVAVLVTGGEPGLTPAEPDGRAVPLPTDRPLAEGDVAGARFDVAVRGYRMAQVDQAMRRAAYDIGYKDELINVLEAEIAALRGGRVEDAEVLRRAREASLAGSARAAAPDDDLPEPEALFELDELTRRPEPLVFVPEPADPGLDVDAAEGDAPDADDSAAGETGGRDAGVAAPDPDRPAGTGRAGGPAAKTVGRRGPAGHEAVPESGDSAGAGPEPVAGMAAGPDADAAGRGARIAAADSGDSAATDPGPDSGAAEPDDATDADAGREPTGDQPKAQTQAQADAAHARSD